MARYWIGFVIGMFIILYIWVILFYFQLGTPTLTRSKWTGESMRLKAQIASEFPSPKIILVGGSSIHFSVSAAQIESDLNIPTVNMALHAGLGLPYILEKIKTVVLAKDIIVLSPEYQHFFDNGSSSMLLMDHIVAQDPEYFMRMSFVEKGVVIAKLGGARLIKGVLTRIGLRFPPPTVGYSAGTISHNGDESINVDARFIGPPAPLPGGKIERTTKTVKAINKFVSWAKQGGITVFATFPPYPKTVTREYANWGDIFLQFWKAIEIPVLGIPDDFFYAERYFFDTSYHMNSYGRKIHTDRLIVSLKKEIHLSAEEHDEL